MLAPPPECSISITVTWGGGSLAQKRLCHSVILPISPCVVVQWECRLPKLELHTPLRWYPRKKWRSSSVAGTPILTLAAASMARQMRKPGATLRWAAGQGFCVWEAVCGFLPSPQGGAVAGLGEGTAA